MLDLTRLVLFETSEFVLVTARNDHVVDFQDHSTKLRRKKELLAFAD